MTDITDLDMIVYSAIDYRIFSERFSGFSVGEITNIVLSDREMRKDPNNKVNEPIFTIKGVVSIDQMLSYFLRGMPQQNPFIENKIIKLAQEVDQRYTNMQDYLYEKLGDKLFYKAFPRLERNIGEAN